MKALISVKLYHIAVQIIESSAELHVLLLQVSTQLKCVAQEYQGVMCGVYLLNYCQFVLNAHDLCLINTSVRPIV